VLVHVSIPIITAAPIHDLPVSFPLPFRSCFHTIENENNFMR
jgi:hypothetical protein